ncbi:MAG: aminotransferase class III-fold pyridoxal phosphate-dependent enzyme [Proteobacteria bacterium]|nr:aminotransferase class III-fold pyridoxal phosphate-dependent enzyme [Pseudomonadota bacterium]
MHLHNEFAPDSLEAKDLPSLLHPSTNLKQHQEHGPVVHERADGVYLWDNKGRQYLEGMAGLWCTALGYGNAELASVAEQQMRKMSYSQLFAGRTNEPSVLLAERLIDMAPMDAGRVFFGLSGSDANDTQIKLLWYYNNAIGRPEKKKIISRQRGYHGITIASGSLTGIPTFHKEFDLPLPGVMHVTCPHYYSEGLAGETEAQFVDRLLAELEQLILHEGAETIAGFIAEPIQGAGGVVVPPKDYLPRVAELLAKNDILFVDDEVICGFGRTGQPFGAQTYGIQPTTMSLAKALSSAYLPISAVLLPEFMHEAFASRSDELGNFGHGFTYSGHPVCAAVALRNLELMEEMDLYNHANRVGQVFQRRLREFSDHPLVGEVRGEGLIAAVELVRNKQPRTPFNPAEGVGAYCSAAYQEAGVILRNLGDSVAFCPPLIINENQIDELITKFAAGLDATLAWAKTNRLI